MKLWDYWFSNINDGEEFFIECSDEDEAWEILVSNGFDKADYEIVQVLTPEEADEIGLDTY